MISIDVLNTLHSVNLGVLSERFHDTLMVLNVSNQVKNELESDKYFSVKFGHTLGGSYIPKEGIMFNIFGSFFGILEINSNKPKSAFHLWANSDSEFHPIEPDTAAQDIELSTINFSMKPPVTLSTTIKPTVISPEQISDPISYIKSRYYSILYSTSIPLSYFPKTAISRLKVLSQNKINLKDHICQIRLTVDQLNARHDGKFGVLKSLDNSTDCLDKQFEISHQADFVTSHNLIQSTESLNNDILQLKLRESQLQIIVLLELILAMELVESNFLYDNHPVLSETQKKVTRRRLIRRKNQPRKIIPTFLGMGVGVSSVETQPDGQKQESDGFSMHSLLHTLDSLIERLRLLDTLYTQKNNTLINFVAYVLVPYYKNNLPLTIKYIIDRIKDSNFKLSSKLKSSRAKQSSKSVTEKKSKTIERPKLVRSADLNLDDKILDPKLMLRRSSSNLSSKNLQRRQVDFSKPVLKSKSMTELNPPTSVFTTQARKLKKPKPNTSLNLSKSFSQVSATPMKPPPKKLIQDLRTPVGVSQPSFINSSPIKEVLLSPINERFKNIDTLKTPVAVNSSPVMVLSSERKKRPGEPIDFIDSPFLDSLRGSSINGSSLPYNNNEDRYD
ncbi:SLD3-domain-containing protein [Yamadazyma tenuis ATCC 10573]|uniref:SLD3-domain-containing protein n=2 Tax=Candida tenuis TaxID=2315449 RepID=G3AY90_CANTC|nr:SLD3-domain-containing protein [Yamadazyma tenuis ATCC 10573]EGV65794.1 SLD3-domain-containing protein [Yamadazyma tenuis ATCC 10573]